MKTHQKMCWSCDGHVHVYELLCPYCGADLSEDEKEEEKLELEELQEESQEKFSFDEVSYHESEGMQEELEHPPFEALIKDVEEAAVENSKWSEPEAQENPDLDNPLASLLLLLPGSLFFLFGLALFLFSHEGVLTFKFSSKYWFVYLLGSWPLLYFGWRSLFPSEPAQEPQEPEENFEA